MNVVAIGRCKACVGFTLLAFLIIASFASLDLKIAEFFSGDSAARMWKFIRECTSPYTDGAFLSKVGFAALETLAMSSVGTLLAATMALGLALVARRFRGVQFLFNALRSIPELVWASLLLIASGLGPFPGTLALALHTAGVLGRLFTEAIQNAAPEPAFALQVRGASDAQVFWYSSFIQVLPQLTSYTLYRWENNIRAAAVLGVVGAGGLGQMLAFHMGLFQMSKTASVLLTMIALVVMVDFVSDRLRAAMQR
jgi:phosphonate transport system permease protein